MNSEPFREDLRNLLNGLLKKTGTKRTVKYYLAHPSSFPAFNPVYEQKGSLTDIPLSRQSLEMLDMLSIPTNRRPPVSYNPAFADRYQPNINLYLNDSHRKHLAQDNGAAPYNNQPAGTYAKHILERLLLEFK